MERSNYLESISIDGEEWVFLSQYGNNYAVSSFGRIASFVKKQPKLLSQPIQESRGKMYRVVSICGKKERVHRIVATAFLPNPHHLREIDHINNNGTDNRVANLRWCTHQENMRNPLTRETQRKYRLTHPYDNVDTKVFFNRHEDKMKPVVQIKDGLVIGRYKSLGEAERNGFKKTAVSAAIHGRLKTYRNCVWMLLSDYTNKVSTYSATCPARS